MSNSTIHEITTLDLPEDHEFREETFKERVWRRARENPAVPIGESLPFSLAGFIALDALNEATSITLLTQLTFAGFAAVIFSFYMASRRMREQKGLEMNYWLRARVITQGKHISSAAYCLLPSTAVVIGFTVLALSWSSGVWERVFPGAAQKQPGLFGPLPASTIGILEGQEARKVQFDGRMRRAEEAHKAEAAAVSESLPKKIVIPSRKAATAKATEEPHDLGGGYWRWLRWESGSSQEDKNPSPGPTSSSLLPRPPLSASADKPKPSGSWLRRVTGMSTSDSDNDKKA
jgi:Hypoxia induced protein conserved region